MTASADSGAGSPRAVVNTAATATRSTAPALNGQIITLSTGQITLNKSLTIDGQTSGVIISSNDTSRVFYSSDTGLPETISNLEFFGNTAPNTGAPDNGNGGAIYASAA